MKKLLFVCLGNICRSPAAEAIMIKMVADKGLSAKYFCDSAGTSGYHIGERADARMIEHAKKRGYDITSRGRQFSKKDFTDFDYILTMDESNYQNVCDKDYKNEYKCKVHPMVKFCLQHQVDKVPDPYYGGPEGFENVLSILEDACSNLLNHLEKE